MKNRDLIVSILGVIIGAAQPVKAETPIEVYQKLLGVKLEAETVYESKGIRVYYEYENVSEFGRYRWINIVRDDPKGAPAVRRGNTPEVPYIDPPKGGWQYSQADNSPYYWDDADCNECLTRYKVNNQLYLQDRTFIFEDVPTDQRLRGDESVKFTTCIVDTHKNDWKIGCINWQLNANGKITYQEH